MGLISNKRMLPLMILMVLWKYSDEDRYISSDKIVEKVLEMYQPNDDNHELSNKRLILDYLKDLQEFLFEMHEYGYFDIDMHIDCKSTKTEYEAGNAKGYCIKNRPFSDVEIKILCDSILFSPGMTDDQAKKLIRKIGLLSSDEFNNVYKYVHVSNIVQKTDNTEVVNNIERIGDAISKGSKVSFTYKNEDIKISPYYLVVYGGRYYCIGNNDKENFLRHYRLDRITSVYTLNEKNKDIYTLPEIKDIKVFRIDDYIKLHPRMSMDTVVTITLNVRENFLDRVKQEFLIYTEYPDFMCKEKGVRRIKVTSCKDALSNWLINVPHLAWVDQDDSSGVVEEMIERAHRIIEVYAG